MRVTTNAALLEHFVREIAHVTELNVVRKKRGQVHRDGGVGRFEPLEQVTCTLQTHGNLFNLLRLIPTTGR